MNNVSEFLRFVFTLKKTVLNLKLVKYIEGVRTEKVHNLCKVLTI